MQNARLDEAQAVIKIARRNINNLRYAHDTKFMAGSKEELKSLLMIVKDESEKAGLKLMYRTDFWTLWEKARVGCFKRTASKHVYYQG